MASLLGLRSRLLFIRLGFPNSLSCSSSPRNLRRTRRTFHHHHRNLRTLARPISKMEQSTDLANGGESSSARVSTMSNGGDADHRIGHFLLPPSSALKIQKGDITRWFVDGSSDAIVNPANELMLGGGGADGPYTELLAQNSEQHAITYKKSDLEFVVPLEKQGLHRRLSYFSFYKTSFRLPASHVIHTVGPIYNVDPNPEASLRSAYRYPFDEAAMMAISTVREFANDFQEIIKLFYVERKVKTQCYGIVLSGASNIIAIGIKVHFVLFADDIYNVWLNKANELLHD
ncbi:unnamed protein product [Camellia sinensis]